MCIRDRFGGEGFVIITESFANLIGQAKKFIVSRISVTKDGDVIYKLTSGAELITGNKLSPQQSFDNLLTVLETKEFKHLTQENFAYIDLRFGNKVYVCKKEDVCAQEEIYKPDINAGGEVCWVCLDCADVSLPLTR